jgi:hypothetical protein
LKQSCTSAVFSAHSRLELRGGTTVSQEIPCCGRCVILSRRESACHREDHRYPIFDDPHPPLPLQAREEPKDDAETAKRLRQAGAWFKVARGARNRTPSTLMLKMAMRWKPCRTQLRTRGKWHYKARYTFPLLGFSCVLMSILHSSQSLLCGFERLVLSPLGGRRLQCGKSH